MHKGAPKSTENDWICSDSQCGNLNFARRTECNKCGKEKGEQKEKVKAGIEIGKALAEKSKGLFSADDWQCSKCGNVNWARRGTCNLCNAPKFCEIEERTGYGGGYNDRGVVEYKEQEESDGEYDEFGRKKKKFRKTTAPSSDDNNSTPLPQKNDRDLQREPVKPVDTVDRREKSDEEEDDDDEDDDDADLSKYDLSGWGDDAADVLREEEVKSKSASNNKIPSDDEKGESSNLKNGNPTSTATAAAATSNENSKDTAASDSSSSSSSAGSSRSGSRSRSRSSSSGSSSSRSPSPSPAKKAKRI